MLLQKTAYLILLPVLIVVALLSACATTPLSVPLPNGFSLNRLANSPGGSPFAWSHDGQKIAYVRGGVRLITVADQSERVLSGPAPAILAWSPDDSMLGLGFATDTQTLLRLQRLTGAVVAETRVPGSPVAIFWGQNGIVVCTSEQKDFTFGANVISRVVRWDGQSPPQVSLLHDVTLKPITIRNYSGFLPGFRSAMSPWGDELLYTRLHDPPEFPPYLKLILRHLDSGAERSIGDLPIASSGGHFVGNADRVVIADGIGTIYFQDLWNGNPDKELPVSGRQLATSPEGRSLLADGELWSNGVHLLTLADVNHALFSPTGEQLLFRSRSTLYLLSGLPTDPLASLPDGEELKKALLLRRWRAMNLISPDEFHQQKGP